MGIRGWRMSGWAKWFLRACKIGRGVRPRSDAVRACRRGGARAVRFRDDSKRKFEGGICGRVAAVFDGLCFVHIRPQMFGYLFLLLMLIAMEKFHRGQRSAGCVVCRAVSGVGERAWVVHHRDWRGGGSLARGLKGFQRGHD